MTNAQKILSVLDAPEIHEQFALSTKKLLEHLKF